MKRFSLACLVLVGTLCSFAAPRRCASLEKHRDTNWPADIIVRCVDDVGNTVTNVTYEWGLSPDEIVEHIIGRKGKTGNDGCFRMKGRTCGEAMYRLTKEGYYRTQRDYSLSGDHRMSIKDGKWQPYGATNTVVLKKIRNPIDMRVIPVSHDFMIPKVGVPLAFDIEKADWLPPYGSGAYHDLDIIFRWDGRRFTDYTGSSIEFIFVQPMSGYYCCPKDEFSWFKTPYRVEEGRAYQTNLVCRDQINKADRRQDVADNKDHQCFILRLRPKMSGGGQVVSAHYGKIYGPIKFGWSYNAPGAFSWRMFYNPTENDMNLESTDEAFNTSFYP